MSLYQIYYLSYTLIINFAIIGIFYVVKMVKN